LRLKKGSTIRILRLSFKIDFSYLNKT